MTVSLTVAPTRALILLLSLYMLFETKKQEKTAEAMKRIGLHIRTSLKMIIRWADRRGQLEFMTAKAGQGLSFSLQKNTYVLYTFLVSLLKTTKPATHSTPRV